eukprot:TRINITY_DN17225_c0_g1_i1.p1 TRINITY_DN17225_c0_g1~~TRINITY_DN17225_c0_g1_i1.p1  ORF type:complete len:364 (-),score=21.95 TRINITY_DN17225_c0_g1_i1:255-1346(-)
MECSSSAGLAPPVENPIQLLWVCQNKQMRCQLLEIHKFGSRTYCNKTYFKTNKRQKCRGRAGTIISPKYTEQNCLPDGFEEALQNNPPPKQFLSQINDNGNSLDLDWWAGFLQYRGIFDLSFQADQKSKTRICRARVYCKFVIQVTQKSLYILMALYELFGKVGTISKVESSQNSWRYVVSSTQIPSNILPIVDQMPLQSKKYQHYVFYRVIAQIFHTKNRNKNELIQYTLYKCLNQYIIDKNKQKKTPRFEQVQLKLESDLQNWLKKTKLLGQLGKGESDKWKRQMIQVVQKKEISESFVVGLADGLGAFQVNFAPKYDSWPLINIHLRFEIVYQDEKVLEEVQVNFNFKGQQIYSVEIKRY